MTTIQHQLGYQVDITKTVNPLVADFASRNAAVHVSGRGQHTIDGRLPRLRNPARYDTFYPESGEAVTAAISSSGGFPVIDSNGFPGGAEGYVLPIDRVQPIDGLTVGWISRRMDARGSIFTVRGAVNDVFNLEYNPAQSNSARMISRMGEGGTAQTVAVALDADTNWHAFVAIMDFTNGGMTLKRLRGDPGSTDTDTLADAFVPDWTNGYTARLFDHITNAEAANSTPEIQLSRFTLYNFVMGGTDLSSFEAALLDEAEALAAAA